MIEKAGKPQKTGPSFGHRKDSLCSKRYCGISEHRKTEKRDFDNFAAQEMGTSEKWSEGGGGKELWNKKWSRGEGGGGKGNACLQRSLF